MTDMLGIRRFVNRLKKDLFPSLERKVYNENIKSAVIKSNGETVMFVLYDSRENIPWWWFSRKGTAFPCENILNMKELPEEEVVITTSFWTCLCDHHFIHHKVQAECPICKYTVSDDTRILKTFGD